jgi:O-antigen ligase
MKPRLRTRIQVPVAVLTGAREPLTAVFVFAVVTATAAADGGYFPPAWGWSALGCLLVVFSLLVLGADVSLTRLEWLFIGPLLALVVWTACSAAWSLSVGRTVQDAQRTAVYASAVLALLAVARGSARAIVAGLATAATAICTYALATRLLPDLLGYDGNGPYRLDRPLGYWNGLAVLAAVGAILSCSLVLHARRRVVRIGAAASLPILVVTMYFTFSRGGWLALALGLAIYVGLDRDRVRTAASLLVLAVVPAVSVAVAAHASALVRPAEPYARAVREGHGFALALPMFAVASGFVAFAAFELRRGPHGSVLTGARARVALVVLIAIGASALLASFGRAGGVQPAASAQHASSQTLPTAFRHPVFSAASNSRFDYWRVAWRQYLSHPVLGSGAGTFELFWNRHRPAPLGSRFDHNLYLQVLAELGPVALALLAAALAAPLIAMRSTREAAVVPAAAGAFIAVITHAAVDWDWQLPAVMIAGLFAGGAVLVASRQPGPPRPLSRGARTGVLCLVLALATFAAVGWRGNHDLALASVALSKGDYHAAAAAAGAAQRWQPWASGPWLTLGLARIGLGDLPGARASFRRAVAKDRADWEPWYDLSLVSHGTERAAALRAARRLNPLNRALGSFAGAKG